MCSPQEHILDLAAVHCDLYKATDASGVRASTFLGDIARHVVGHQPVSEP